MTKSEKLKKIIEGYGHKNVRVEYQRFSDAIEIGGGEVGYYAGVGENAEQLCDYLGWDFEMASKTAERYYKNENRA